MTTPLAADAPVGAAQHGPRLWTIGHSTRTVGELLELLAAHGVGVVVDVRSYPRSARNPQFDRETLADALEAAGIGYRHDRGLGGLRKPRPDSRNLGWKNPGFRGYADHMETPEFGARLEELIALTARSRTAVMCAEAVPWRCHRSLIADAMTARGFDVEHILSPGAPRPHRLTPFARVDTGLVSYPGLLES